MLYPIQSWDQNFPLLLLQFDTNIKLDEVTHTIVTIVIIVITIVIVVIIVIVIMQLGDSKFARQPSSQKTRQASSSHFCYIMMQKKRMCVINFTIVIIAILKKGSAEIIT